MRLLRIHAEGIELFDEAIDLSFYTTQRLLQEQKEELISVGNNIYLNPVVAFTGKNASGKTSVLRLIDLSLALLDANPINLLPSKSILDGCEKAKFKIYFVVNNSKVGLLESTVSKNNGRVSIIEETVYLKDISDIKKRADICDFDGVEPYIHRQNNGDIFIQEDMSIMAILKLRFDVSLEKRSFLEHTNFNTPDFDDYDVPEEILKFLDDTIEYIKFSRDGYKKTCYLKFYNSQEIVLGDKKELLNYLSSGTIKGMNLIKRISFVLDTAGVLIIDEIENHFNKEIVATIIRFFLDPTINKYGGVLLFSTHYAELLDELTIKDSVFICENSCDGLKVKCFSDLIERNDIKKSALILSGCIGNTCPSYENYILLKKYLINGGM